MPNKRLNFNKRKDRTRFKLKKNNISRLRLCFYSSNKYIYTQVINDKKNITITGLVTYSKEFKNLKKRNNIEAAEMLGEKIAKLLIKKEINKVFFDRGGHQYYGKTKAFAESARKNGLIF